MIRQYDESVEQDLHRGMPQAGLPGTHGPPQAQEDNPKAGRRLERILKLVKKELVSVW